MKRRLGELVDCIYVNSSYEEFLSIPGTIGKVKSSTHVIIPCANVGAMFYQQINYFMLPCCNLVQGSPSH